MTRSSGGANQSDVFAEIKGLVNDMSAKLEKEAEEVQAMAKTGKEGRTR